MGVVGVGGEREIGGQDMVEDMGVMGGEVRCSSMRIMIMKRLRARSGMGGTEWAVVGGGCCSMRLGF